MMKCGFCGYEFDPAEAETACNGCPLVRDCRLVRCPRCNYEMPPEPGLIKWLRGIRAKHEMQHGIYHKSAHESSLPAGQKENPL